MVWNLTTLNSIVSMGINILVPLRVSETYLIDKPFFSTVTPGDKAKMKGCKLSPLARASWDGGGYGIWQRELHRSFRSFWVSYSHLGFFKKFYWSIVDCCVMLWSIMIQLHIFIFLHILSHCYSHLGLDRMRRIQPV